MNLEEFEQLKQHSIGHKLIKAARVYNEFAFNTVKDKAKFDNLRPSHLSLFAHIPFEGTTIVQLAQKLNISKQAVSVMVKDLLSENILIKKDNPEDSRSFLITFSKEKGSRLFEGVKLLAALDINITEDLSDKELQVFNKALDKIILKFE